jgi:hypothetical protein
MLVSALVCKGEIVDVNGRYGIRGVVDVLVSADRRLTRDGAPVADRPNISSVFSCLFR